MTPRYFTARRLVHLLALGLLVLAGNGCAGFWDEVLSRERDMHGYFHPPDPLTVIRESTDGERRGKAMASLREPLQHGGTQKDQDTYIEILTTAARTDPDPYCRLGAIQALGYFKDPRAAQALEDSYKRTKVTTPFTKDFNEMIRLTALRSLDKIGTDESLRLLILVAGQPGPTQESASGERQQIQDERLTCIRALGKYHQSEALETLIHILDPPVDPQRKEDPAVRDAAHESLKLATGKNLPPEPQTWRALLAGQQVHEEQPSLIQRVSGWFK